MSDTKPKRWQYDQFQDHPESGIYALSNLAGFLNLYELGPDDFRIVFNQDGYGRRNIGIVYFATLPDDDTV